MNKVYLCIDLKSFYASVECVERGLDPFTTDLVVADPSRGNGAICLAVSPSLKQKGVKNRCRIFEIPKDIDYDKINNIASEARQKLKEVRPTTIAQAIRISGVNPSDISILSVYLKKEYPKDE